MSAAARAEARRKAILARGGDRLAKLTSSARGEDAAAFAHDDPPLAPLPSKTGIERFVGEEPTLPPPSAFTHNSRNARPSSSASRPNAMPPNQPAFNDEQAQLMNALLGGAFPPGMSDGSVPPADANPLAALMSSMNAGGPNPFSGAQPQTHTAPKPKSLLQNLMPLIHLVAMWILLAYFVIWKEPEAYEVQTHGLFGSEKAWKRWADLNWTSAGEGWGVQPLPFFWAFTTLTLVLHSWRIFSGIDAIQTPMLLSLAMSVLPPALSTTIMTILKYLQIGGVFLDDLAGLLVGIGILIFVASWVAG